MVLDAQAQKRIAEEEACLDSVLCSLQQQLEYAGVRLQAESQRARELTSALVATRRDEEKQLLASDEAVAHGLSKNKQQEIKSIEQLLPKPYFARIVLEEESPAGIKQIEYKLGIAANPDCRIIDWRKAPIAKLYYEYREGDSYSETILGKERDGTVSLRNSIDVKANQLKELSCGLGHFVRTEQNNEWKALSAPDQEGGIHARSGELPHILSLISAEQFKLITEEASSAVLIQGVAGSGKTTVALHRLAWLLHEDNRHPEQEPLTAEQSLVLVVTQPLKSYLAHVLPSMGIEGVRIQTLLEWCSASIAAQMPQLRESAGRLKLRAERPGRSIERLKRSMAWLNCLETAVRAARPSADQLDTFLAQLLRQPEKILTHDETRLLDAALVHEAAARAQENLRLGQIDKCDLGGTLRALQVLSSLAPGSASGMGLTRRLRQITVDEVQELSAVELACIVGAVEQPQQLTLVGDIAQATSAETAFPGWQTLRTRWALGSSISKYIQLEVSFRSTLPIMKLACYVQRQEQPQRGRAGRVPLWFSSRKESRALQAAIDWLRKAVELYPMALTAILTASKDEAHYLYGLLSPSFGSSVRLGDAESFHFDAGMVVAPISLVRGLEFCNVLLWNPSEKNYPADTLGRNRLYIALTRACENLCIVSQQKASPALPSRLSALVRGVDLDQAE
jgi:DNA helicase-2/ATP-dependent DNA helicase PcrA